MCNKGVERRYFFARMPGDGKWHRFHGSGTGKGAVGDTLGAQFDGVPGMADVLALHRELILALFALKLCGHGGWDEEPLPEGSDENEVCMSLVYQ